MRVYKEVGTNYVMLWPPDSDGFSETYINYPSAFSELKPPLVHASGWAKPQPHLGNAGERWPKWAFAVGMI